MTTSDACQHCKEIDGQHSDFCPTWRVPHAAGGPSLALGHPPPRPAPEYTGGSVSYYRVRIESPTTPGARPYTAECNDIIEALGMDYAEGNAFKALWRSCAARNLGVSKAGYKDGLYDAEKVEFFGKRMVVKAKAALAALRK